jgi:murein L,D-transpeptidase YafK
MKNLLIPILIISCLQSSAQGNGVGSSTVSIPSFINYQKSLQRPSDAMKRKEDVIKKEFESKGIKWPAKYVYIRSFKYDSQLEVWVKNDRNEKYKLFKTYKVCALAGTMGPKRLEGDYQVPEGFYYINEFNPRSSYHLSLGLNYPNTSDKILSDVIRPGGDIYIHGSCVTVGCIPLTDPMIEELYIISAHAKDQGQDFIPVHIFPIRYNVKKSVDYLERLTNEDLALKTFSSNLSDAFNYFEKHKQLPVVMITAKGDYLINDAPPKFEFPKEEEPEKRKTIPRRTRNISSFSESVTQWPTYQGGGQAFLKYLDKLGKEMRDLMPKGLYKAYIQVEFIIDKDGTPVNFKIVKGGVNEDFDEELITQLEKSMVNWEPALLSGKPVAKKMVQTIAIEVPEPMKF